MGEVIVVCAIVVGVLSPLLRRFYIKRFWTHGRATIKRLDEYFISPNTEGWEGYTWTIEYDAAGQRFSSKMSSATRQYSVGDEVEILYNPRRPSSFIRIRESWAEYVVYTIVIGVVVAGRLPPRKDGQ